MKKVIKYVSLLVAGSALLVACSKKDDVTPTTPDNTPSGTDVCQTDKKLVYIQMDASTNNSQSSFNNKSFSCSVKAGQGTDTLYFDVKSKKDLDRIYIKKSEDNGVTTNLVGLPGLKTVDGAQTVAGNSDFSYEVPGSNFTTNAFKVKIPVNVRSSSAAETDVYTIWFTNGSGDFLNSGKNTVVGPIYVTLYYKDVVPYYSTSTALKLGDQNNTTDPSYITGSGGIATLSGASLQEASMTAEARAVSLNGADFNFVGLNSDGSAIGDGSTPWFIGVGTRTSVGFTGNTEGTNVTKFAKVTLPTTFANLTGSNIKALAAPTESKVKVESGADYVFLTQDGRKGVIHTSALSTATTGKSVLVDVKVLSTN